MNGKGVHSMLFVIDVGMIVLTSGRMILSALTPGPIVEGLAL